MKKRRYSLSIHISSLFFILILFIGSVLIAISYHSSQQLLAGSAKTLAHENSQKLETVFTQNVAPILTTLDFLATSTFIENTTPPLHEQRWLTSIVRAFQQSANLNALYFANETGQFFMFRPLLSRADRVTFAAPDDAVLWMNYSNTSGTNDIYFLNQDMKLVGQYKEVAHFFDPRVRPWYLNAENDGIVRLTEPYLFFTLQTYGLTLSRRSFNGKQVVGADLTLKALSNELGKLGFSDHSQLVLLDQQLRPLAEHNSGLNLRNKPEQIKQSLLNDDTPFASVMNRISSQPQYDTPHSQDKDWVTTLTPVKLNQQLNLFLAQATPKEELLADLITLRNRQITSAIVLLLLCFPVVIWVAKRLSSPMHNLIQLTDNIARFNFKKTRYPQTLITEVGNLSQSIQLMEHALHDLLRLLRETTNNQDFSQLAKTIAHQSYVITKAETILLYVLDQEGHDFSVAANHAIIPFKIDINQLLNSSPWLLAELRKGETIHLNRQDNILRAYLDQLYNSDLYFFPLLNRDRQLVGIVCLGYERAVEEAQIDKHAFLRELLSFAEIAKDNIDKIQQQKEMLKAFVELIASAIDTKSPYTGGHCQRVPELTRLLAEAAAKDKRYFPEFTMNAEQWEELTLAAWLHDCGKVTTPEFVVDKATKLETIYDRIHEVRMRFELLKMQAERDYWQTCAQGGDRIQAEQALKAQHQQLDAEFAFVAQCNLGSEGMSDADIERLEQIAQRQWKRTLDDQIGISWIEKCRAAPSSSLPVWEPLLADKLVHQFEWPQGKTPQEMWQEEFCLKPPALQYNRGELHNLKVKRGTLTAEDRFMINDHIVQTILMLQRLPYPKHLQGVPEIAGGHHERMDGQGYPRGLDASQLSIPARVMAIADVFEALTSSDRPYKKAKSLQECITIMTEMATSGHIDPKLYLLFLQQNLHLVYAERFLNPEQYQNGVIETQEHIRKVQTYLREVY
ncbi:HD domain-containing phosphohydrolase [Vibrio metoecus]|uniref:HD domain-containing phosphohydrolase n=1 Tax=Vibrio metoecus TaxID=1481663 RepID=UPI0015960096|nr:HD domain-containing phosphohydrolase [Vibrio metoecus]